MPNPLDEALSAKQKLAQDRKEQAHALWHTWKQDPTPQNMRPLMQHFEPVFKSKMIQWRAPQVDESAFMAKAQNLAVNAFRTYNPNQGAAVNTWLEHKLQPLKRFNVQHQNPAMLPEGQALRIGDINRATDELTEQFGREPTPHEIAEHLNPELSARQQLTAAKVERIRQGQRKAIIGSTFESDPVPRAVSRERQVIGQLRPTLTTDQQEVFDYLYGESGKPKIKSKAEIARRVGKSPSQVSRLINGIIGKYNEYI